MKKQSLIVEFINLAIRTWWNRKNKKESRTRPDRSDNFDSNYREVFIDEDKMHELAKKPMNVELYISLHWPDTKEASYKGYARQKFSLAVCVDPIEYKLGLSNDNLIEFPEVRSGSPVEIAATCIWAESEGGSILAAAPLSRRTVFLDGDTPVFKAGAVTINLETPVVH